MFTLTGFLFYFLLLKKPLMWYSQFFFHKQRGLNASRGPQHNLVVDDGKFALNQIQMTVKSVKKIANSCEINIIVVFL